MAVLVIVMGLGPRPAERRKLSPTLGAATVTFSCMCSVALGGNKISLNLYFPTHIAQSIFFTSRDQRRPEEAPDKSKRAFQAVLLGGDRDGSSDQPGSMVLDGIPS